MRTTGSTLPAIRGDAVRTGGAISTSRRTSSGSVAATARHAMRAERVPHQVGARVAEALQQAAEHRRGVPQREAPPAAPVAEAGQLGHDHAVIPRELRRRRPPPARGAAEAVDQHHRPPVTRGLVPDRVAGEGHPRAVSAWTPTSEGIWLHARLLRPPGRSEGPIVMLHGLGVSAASLGPLAEILSERHAVAVIDLPGFGRTSADRVWTTGEVAEAVATAMERRSFRQRHAGGALVGLPRRRRCSPPRHPELVSRLVMLSPGFDGGRGGPLGLVLRLAADAPMERPSLLGGAMIDYMHAGPRRVIGDAPRGVVAAPRRHRGGHRGARS